MQNAFKRAFLVLLTMLFVSATPVTAYAQPTTKTSLNLVSQTTLISDEDDAEMPAVPACVSYDGALNPDLKAKLEAAGGNYQAFEGPEAQALLSRIEDLVNQKAPYSISQIIVVWPAADAEDYNVAFFSDNCLKGVIHLPKAVVDHLLGQASRVPAKGEKVD